MEGPTTGPRWSSGVTGEDPCRNSPSLLPTAATSGLLRSVLQTPAWTSPESPPQMEQTSSNGPTGEVPVSNGCSRRPDHLATPGVVYVIIAPGAASSDAPGVSLFSGYMPNLSKTTS